MSVVVTLSPEWEDRATRAGNARQDYAEREGLRNFGRELPADISRARHIVGCRAECAVAKVLRLPWKPQVGVITGIDVGGKIEVRARRLPAQHCDLAHRDHDKDKPPYVLVYCHPDQSLELVGWLYGHEMRARAPGCDVRYKVTYIPPPYRDVVELIERYGNGK